MVIDNKGMSHKPKGLPRHVAGTYEGLAATMNDNDLDTTPAIPKWTTLPSRPGSNRRTTTSTAGSILHRADHDPTPVQDAAGMLHQQTGLTVNIDMTRPHGIITLTDGQDTWTIGRQGRILTRRHGNDERHVHDYATDRTIDDDATDWSIDTDKNLTRMLEDMPANWRPSVTWLMRVVEED